MAVDMWRRSILLKPHFAHSHKHFCTSLRTCVSLFVDKFQFSFVMKWFGFVFMRFAVFERPQMRIFERVE